MKVKDSLQGFYSGYIYGALQKEIALRVDFCVTTLANDLGLLVNKFRGIL